MGTTVVLLEVQVKPECVQEVKDYLKEALPDTRAYDGCQSIDIYGNLRRVEQSRVLRTLGFPRALSEISELADRERAILRTSAQSWLVQRVFGITTALMCSTFRSDLDFETGRPCRPFFVHPTEGAGLSAHPTDSNFRSHQLQSGGFET